jgi:hypothetical protein
MQSQYHNLPKINGEDQVPGREYKSRNTNFSANSRRAVFTTDIAGSYPESANVAKWVRTYTLERGRRFIIGDNYELKSISNQPTTQNLVTYCKVSERGAGEMELQGDGFKLLLKYDDRQLEPTIEFIEVNDESLRRYWPDGVTRIVFKHKKPSLKGNSSIEIRPL